VKREVVVAVPADLEASGRADRRSIGQFRRHQ
jgi:hypothetical protein